MKDTVIRAEQLGKKYLIGHHARNGNRTFREQMVHGLRNFYTHSKQLVKGEQVLEGEEVEEFWALRNLDFEIERGERVGIIGRNGAGKSTLLKILSRITEPTSGRIIVNGRVASLLEVGTGFHQELTGRENIFLNGAILGMSRSEIKNKFDEIVEFSGVEKFLDTPVKRYSSGMYVRLAFSIAAHLEPDILVVDEVLAVGDAEFQKKCLGKMEDVSHTKGRTVLFVSHNMATVKQLCNKGIVMSGGKIVFQGSASEAVNHYQLSSSTNSSFRHTGPLDAAPGNEDIRVLSFNVLPLQGDVLSVSSGIRFDLKFYNRKKEINLDATFELRTLDEVPVFHHGALITTNNNSQQGIYEVSGSLPGYMLNAGTYKFKLIFGENQRYALYIVDDFVQFEILNEAMGSNSAVLPGVLRLDIPYQISFKEPVNGQ
jgi:lipopolysaccharide transport system ATP-binding protein